MWILITLLCAFSLAARDSAIKLLSHEHSVLFLSVFAGLVSGLATLAYHAAFHDVDARVFFGAENLPLVAVLLPLDCLAAFLYYLALTWSPLSLTVPFLAFTPALIPLTSWLIVGEGVSAVAFVGILLVVIGGYALFFHSFRELLIPFKRFAREKGSVLMFVVAVMFSVTSVLGRKMVLRVGSANMGAFYPISTALLLLAVYVLSGRAAREPLRVGRPRLLLAAGLAGAVMITAHFVALSMVNTAYMISVKRTSALFSLAFAAILFKERDIAKRLVGAFLMLAGVAVIACFG